MYGLVYCIVHLANFCVEIVQQSTWLEEQKQKESLQKLDQNGLDLLLLAENFDK